MLPLEDYNVPRSKRVGCMKPLIAAALLLSGIAGGVNMCRRADDPTTTEAAAGAVVLGAPTSQDFDIFAAIRQQQLTPSALPSLDGANAAVATREIDTHTAAFGDSNITLRLSSDAPPEAKEAIIANIDPILASAQEIRALLGSSVAPPNLHKQIDINGIAGPTADELRKKNNTGSVAILDYSDDINTLITLSLTSEREKLDLNSFITDAQKEAYLSQRSNYFRDANNNLREGVNTDHFQFTALAQALYDSLLYPATMNNHNFVGEISLIIPSEEMSDPVKRIMIANNLAALTTYLTLGGIYPPLFGPASNDTASPSPQHITALAIRTFFAINAGFDMIRIDGEIIWVDERGISHRYQYPTTPDELILYNSILDILDSNLNILAPRDGPATALPVLP